MGEHGGSERGILTKLDRHPLGSGEGLVAEVSRGSYLVADVEREATRLYLVLLRRGDPAERLSLAHTRIAQGHLFLGPMSNLVSNRRRVLARICEDDVRAHDILSSCGADLNLPCRSRRHAREKRHPGVVAAGRRGFLLAGRGPARRLAGHRSLAGAAG